MGPWYTRAPMLGLAALCLVSPRSLKTSAVWIALAVLIMLRIASDWPLADNHIYLLAYWCLAAGLSLRTSDADRVLAANARSLIGLAFACALVWKLVLSSDFVDGRFFRVTLLTDPRFTEVTQIVGGLSNGQLETNRRTLEPLPEGAEPLEPPAVVEPVRLRAFAYVSTWGVLALEAALAVAMLMPTSAFVGVARHAALLTFCVITYAVAPVAGFGWLLLVMGAAQVESERRWLTTIYVAGFVLVLFYSEVPWTRLVLDWIRG
jgi:hypothetical protein